MSKYPPLYTNLYQTVAIYCIFSNVTDELCQCPQKCDERVPMEARRSLFEHFYGMGDADLQNAFLRDHMDVRARTNYTPTAAPLSVDAGCRSPRRITCKYLVPIPETNEKIDVCQKAFVSAFVITTKRVRLQREKLISSMGLNSYRSHGRSYRMLRDTPSPGASSEDVAVRLPTSLRLAISSQCDLERCNGAWKNRQESTFGPSDGKRRKMLVDDPLVPFGLLVPEGVTIAPVTATPDHDRDIAIVNNFFSNQLWKPEYIGTHS